MQYIPEGTEIVLWGVGEIGHQVIAGEFGNYEITFAVDRKVDANTTVKVGDISVYSPSALDDPSFWRNTLLVIGVWFWGEIAAELEKRGRHIFRDYVPYIYLKYETLDIGFLKFCKDDEERIKFLKELSSGKKLCGMYGGCHMPVYRSMLCKSKQFTEEYYTVDLQFNSRPGEPRVEMLRMPWIYSHLDLLILSFVYPTNGSPDWRTVKNWTEEKCKVILVTNAAFKGYFPQHTTPIPETISKTRWGDKNLNKMILAGETANIIFQTVSMPNFYDAEKVNRFFENELNKLEQNESECDIRIGDYIRKYGRRRRLMHCSTHPDECVMKEIALRIFIKLGLNTEMLEAMPESDMLSLRQGGEFIYPSVYHALGITGVQEDEKVCVNWDKSNPVTFSEYVDLYVEVNKPYIMTKYGS